MIAAMRRHAMKRLLAPVRLQGVELQGKVLQGQAPRPLTGPARSRQPLRAVYPFNKGIVCVLDVPITCWHVRCSWGTGRKGSPMRVVLVILIALFAVTSGPARADNPYAAAGISNPAHVTQFLARLRQAVTADDHAAVAAMVQYPLTISSDGRSITYRNAAALSVNYALVFTPEVKAAVAAAKPDNLFVRDQGVMIGNGEIWINEVGGLMKIITVNHTR
jgi:hypothetical protein